MFDNLIREEADRQAAQLAASLEQLVDWLTAFVRTRIGHSAAASHDVHDIVQMTLFQVLEIAGRQDRPIDNPRRYLMQVALSCISDYFRRKARQPRDIGNPEQFVDGRAIPPEQAAQDREESAARERGLVWLRDWRPRVCDTLITFDGQLGELDEFRQTFSPLFGFGQRRSKRRGRPTQVEHVGRLLVELRPQVAELAAFFAGGHDESDD
jgi:DNA-directed RNA polymerase specialized sigma24 family protein